MHDVLDLRDLVPDEVQQLALSGFEVGDLSAPVRGAAAAGDLARLRELWEELSRRPRASSWGFIEPDDDAELLASLSGIESSPVPADVEARIRGAWLGRAVGNTLGKPVEGLGRAEVESYLRAAGQWPLAGYLPLLDPLPPGVAALHPSAPTATAGRFSDVPRDDDIDWTILGLHILETHGRNFTTEQVAVAWLDRVPFTQTYTAERAAYRNLVHGFRPPRTATVDNPYREWIGALIRGDVFGYVSPGEPAEAARMALVDARLSHTCNGKYGEMWAAALTACALSAPSMEEAVSRSLVVVPPHSRLRAALDGVVALRRTGASSADALDWIEEELGRYPWVHTVNNAALIVIGLLWGESFLERLGITLAGGRDTDSNGATVGSVHGALLGAAAIPRELVGRTHVRVRSAIRDYDRVRLDELADRTLSLIQDGRPNNL